MEAASPVAQQQSDENEKPVLAYFKWKIPQYSIERNIVLCHGYTREQCNTHIPHEIVYLFSEYSNDIESIIDPIRKTVHTSMDTDMLWFSTDVFEYKSCKFFILLCPNWRMYDGYSQMTMHDRDGERSRKQFSLVLHASEFPKCISRVEVEFHIKFILTTKQNKTVLFDTTTGYIFPDKSKNDDCRNYIYSCQHYCVLDFIVKNDDVSQVESFEFEIQFQEFSVYDAENTLIDDNIQEDKLVSLNDHTLKSDSYYWEIDNALEINKIKQAKIRHSFTSPLFMFNGFVWIMTLYPIKNKRYDDEEDYVRLDLDLVKTPHGFSVHRMCIFYKILFDATLIDQRMVILELHQSHCGTVLIYGKDLETRALQMCEKPNFYVEVTTMNIFDADGEEIPLENIKQNVYHLPSTATNTYQWHIFNPSMIKQIKNAAAGQSFLSNCFSLYSLKWILELTPRNVHLAVDWSGTDKYYSVILKLYLCKFPENIRSISFAFTLKCHETNTEYSSCFNDWNIKNKRDKVLQWDRHHLESQEILDLDTLTFSVQIRIFSVSDKDFNDATSHYIESKQNVNIITLPIPVQFTWDIFEMDSKAMDMSDTDDGKLSELMSGYPLKLTPAAKNALTDIFKQFARTNNTMSGYDKEQYLLCCGIALTHVSTLQTFLDDYDESYAKHYISNKGIWDNLMCFGYGNDLQNHYVDRKSLQAARSAIYFGQSHVSNIFEMFKCYWYFHIQDSAFFLRLLSIPTDISYMVCYCKLSSNNSYFSSASCKLFGKNKQVSFEFDRIEDRSPNNWYSREKGVKNLSIKGLVFTVKMVLVEMYDINDNIITEQFIEQEEKKEPQAFQITKTLSFPHEEYQWNVSKSKSYIDCMNNNKYLFIKYTKHIFNGNEQIIDEKHKQQIFGSFNDDEKLNVSADNILNIPCCIYDAYKNVMAFALELESERFTKKYRQLNRLPLHKQITTKVERLKQGLLSTDYGGKEGKIDYVHYKYDSDEFKMHGLVWQLNISKNTHSDTQITLSLKSKNVKSVVVCFKLISLTSDLGIRDILEFDWIFDTTFDWTFDLKTKIFDLQLNTAIFDIEMDLISIDLKCKDKKERIATNSAVGMLDSLINNFIC